MFLFNLFKKKQTLISRKSRGFDIIMSEALDKQLRELHYNVSVTCNKDGEPNCVQLTKTKNGKNVYISSLKKFLGVKSFKNYNLCDFSPDNLIYKD